uniref:Uncharacterized protein LOC111100634 isoform X2 n=1 Tax=Crassostrea virginica TaxID=6565 RepID=A0A8B8AB76_CRAVI|nr:uncharacterized protein LOC111100634 isoform X2 [Crassostrea virginica]
MPSVEKCPATLAEVNASSKLLNCGFDPYGNNRYMCLPNTEKSSLVEFCFDGLMGIQEKGNCLEEKDGRVILHSCSTFLSGCPKKPFNNYDFYKYPACLDINLQHFCYESDPSCQALGNSGVFSNISNDDRIIMYGLIGGLLAFVILTAVIAAILSHIRWKNAEEKYNSLKKEVGRIRKEENITDKNTKQDESATR